MKIQHWAIIFIIIILPFSIICRSVISKKNVLLRDETRINNVVDNATYDAVSQIVEISEELGYGKNIPMTAGVADAAIDRFFNTMSVNFNLPIGRELAESYFTQYIPAIIIVGYDGLYVYSYEQTAKGYEFVLKPKIPYSQEYILPGTSKTITINYTLDNYVTIYFPNDIFLKDSPDSLGNLDTNGTHILSGYIGEMMDVDGNGVDDFNDFLTAGGYLIPCAPGNTQYVFNDDPYSIHSSYTDHSVAQINYIKNSVPMFTDNLSYILKEWAKAGSGASPNTANYLNFLYATDANQDYVYDDDGNIVTDASAFHVFRRSAIVDLITNVLREEFNEHNNYTDTLGMTYEFNIPEIGRDQWNNTINDISVLAFFQGMPIGHDSYYNNYSLGGTRIVQASYLYAERVQEYEGGPVHWVYHKEYCRYIPRDVYGNIIYGNAGENNFQKITFKDGKVRWTNGIEQIYVNTDHAKEGGYHVCSECM